MAIGAVLIIGLLAAADFGIHLMLKNQQVTRLKATLQQRYEQLFEGSAASGTELDQARYRLGVIDKALDVVNASRGNALPTLSAFARQVPADMPVTVRDLTIDGSIILIEAETTSFDAVEKIHQTFASSPQFQDVSVTDTRVGATPNQVVFRMTVTVQQS